MARSSKVDGIDRDLGEQPICGIMTELGLTGHDIVLASPEQITHKMVSRACKGRRLTQKVQFKILRALNNAAEKEYSLRDVFNY